MPANAAAENALGTIGTICWTVQLIPQVWKSWRTKSTEGLSEWLVLLWGFSGVTFAVYAIVQNLNIPLILQPHLFGTLSYVSWAQATCQHYGRKRSKAVSVALYLAVMTVSAGLEVGMIFAVQPAYRNGNSRPLQFFGIFSSVLIAVALLPQYWEIYKHKEVVGISIVFMLVDMLGGVFSDLSLAFKEHFDIVASVTYSLVVVMDAIVIVCALVLNPAARRRRKRLAENDVVPEGIAVHSPQSVAERQGMYPPRGNEVASVSDNAQRTPASDGTP
ncbi:PQ-loop-domain-containing protein [Trametes cingulata]|nr:PQ-loop-domain-containing protein [Trametes cingulata]